MILFNIVLYDEQYITMSYLTYMSYNFDLYNTPHITYETTLYFIANGHI